MAAGAVWWVAAACVLVACGDTVAGRAVTWPSCSTTYFGNLANWGKRTMEVVDPGQTDIYTTHIDSIHLTDCNFTTVNLNSLKIYQYVLYIDIKDIKVTNITALTFENFPYLQILTMSNSSILGKNLPSTLLRNFDDLKFINFIDNDMRDTPVDLLQGLNLTVLLLTNCNLREVPSFFTSQIFPRLYSFRADHNEISEIDPATFTKVVNLTKLNLSSNRLKHLHADLLKPLTKIQRIYLNNNKLMYIPEAFFQYKPSLVYVDLSNNQIENISLNAFLGTDLKQLYLSDNKLMHLPQNFILNLHSIGVTLIRFNFHGNPWECAYLNKLLVGVKKLKIGYNRSQYDGRHQACNIY